MLTKEKPHLPSEIVSKHNIQHVAIIMDGNRRWAKEKKMPTAIGHKKGVDALKKTVKACHNFGIKYLTVYAFSTENWNRSKEEVDYLMELFALTIKNEFKELHENGVVLNFIGDMTKFKPKLQKIFKDAVDKTKHNTGVRLQIAVNYGSRDEMVNAVKNIVSRVQSDEISLGDINEEIISESLYTSGIPDPDYLIRTGGEMRISNYLLWQVAYSELIVIKDFWPEFDEDLLAKTLKEFSNRQRRFGE